MTSTGDYDFMIPPEKVAQRPRPYGEHKLLVYKKQSKSIEHTSFEALTSILTKGDVLVMNNTKVVPAQLRTIDASKDICASVLILNPLHPSISRPNQFDVILSSDCETGTVLTLPEGMNITIDSIVGGEPKVYKGTLSELENEDEELIDYLTRVGEMPLPPYIERPPDADDNLQYQTSVASDVGAIAAPTAGLHFYPELLDKLKDVGVEVVCITLHVGYGTFRGFTTDSIEEHKMDQERYVITKDSYISIKNALNEKRRIFAVGTTSTRVLETCGDILLSDHEPEKIVGQSELFIYPPYEFKVISGLFTNFHYPKTTVLTLTAAMVGSRDELIDNIYKEALEKDYLWFSYGDGMLVLPPDLDDFELGIKNEVAKIVDKTLQASLQEAEDRNDAALDNNFNATTADGPTSAEGSSSSTEQDEAAKKIQTAMLKRTGKISSSEDGANQQTETGENENDLIGDGVNSDEAQERKDVPVMGGMGGIGLLHPVPPENTKPSFNSPRKIDSVSASAGVKE